MLFGLLVFQLAMCFIHAEFGNHEGEMIDDFVDPDYDYEDEQDFINFMESLDVENVEEVKAPSRTRRSTFDPQQRRKPLASLTESDLMQIYEETRLYTQRNDQGKYKRRAKEHNPKKKLYQNRTIEVGIFIDQYFWRRVQYQLNTKRNLPAEQHESHLLLALHKMMKSAEKILKSETISKDGGFDIVINGINIWKPEDEENNDFIAKIHGQGSMRSMLSAFSDYAQVYNDPYDGNVLSYDVMILIDGWPSRLTDVVLGTDAGLTYVYESCTLRDSVAVVTSRFRNGYFSSEAEYIIAHEIGHLLGARHDGENGCSRYGNVMNPTVSYSRTWSKCSRDQIDAHLSSQEESNPNRGTCFRT